MRPTCSAWGFHSSLILGLACFGGQLLAADEMTWWVQPCDSLLAKTTTCERGDTELAKWALEAWARESGGALKLKPASGEEHARLRIYWANGQSALYGETQPVMVDGKPGAVMYVLPGVAPGADPLMRATVVYLTCLHESGHALGLAHTRNFEDIMYSFQFGGDINAYFHRYRDLLKTREDIPKHSGVSDSDRQVFNRVFR